MPIRSSVQGKEARQKILEAVDNFWIENWYSPNRRELCEATGITSTSVVTYHLGKMAEAGDIIYIHGISRGILPAWIKSAIEHMQTLKAYGRTPVLDGKLKVMMSSASKAITFRKTTKVPA